MSYNVKEMQAAQELVKAIKKMMTYEMTPARRFDLQRLKAQWEFVAAQGRPMQELQTK